MFCEAKMKTLLEWIHVKGFDIGMRINESGMGEVVAYKGNDKRVLIIDTPKVAAQYVRSTR